MRLNDEGVEKKQGVIGPLFFYVWRSADKIIHGLMSLKLL